MSYLLYINHVKRHINPEKSCKAVKCVTRNGKKNAFKIKA